MRNQGINPCRKGIKRVKMNEEKDNRLGKVSQMNPDENWLKYANKITLKTLKLFFLEWTGVVGSSQGQRGVDANGVMWYLIWCVT